MKTHSNTKYEIKNIIYTILSIKRKHEIQNQKILILKQKNIECKKKHKK